jgi:serine protease Do
VLEGCAAASIPNFGDTSDWKIDKQNDLAVVRVIASAGKPYLMLRSAPPRLGEDIAAFGHPLHGLLSDSVKITTGNINSLVGIENDTRYLQVSTPLQPGNSGGPIVDRSGAVLGVASAVLGAKFTEATGISAQNVNFAVHSSVLELFLRSRNIRHEKTSEAGAPLSTVDLAERTAATVGGPHAIWAGRTDTSFVTSWALFALATRY